MSDDPMAVAIEGIEFLQHRCDMQAAHIAKLKGEIATVRAERDEARREVCLLQELVTRKSSRKVAEVRGWDCFEEDGK